MVAIPLKRDSGWQCEEETKAVRGGSFAGDRRDPVCRLYAVERDRRAGRNTAFGGGATPLLSLSPILTLAPEPEETEYIPDAAEVEALAKMLYRGSARDRFGYGKAACVWCVREPR